MPLFFSPSSFTSARSRNRRPCLTSAATHPRLLLLPPYLPTLDNFRFLAAWPRYSSDQFRSFRRKASLRLNEEDHQFQEQSSSFAVSLPPSFTSRGSRMIVKPFPTISLSVPYDTEPDRALRVRLWWKSLVEDSRVKGSRWLLSFIALLKLLETISYTFCHCGWFLRRIDDIGYWKRRFRGTRTRSNWRRGKVSSVQACK